MRMQMRFCIKIIPVLKFNNLYDELQHLPEKQGTAFLYFFLIMKWGMYGWILCNFE